MEISLMQTFKKFIYLFIFIIFASGILNSCNLKSNCKVVSKYNGGVITDEDINIFKELFAMEYQNIFSQKKDTEINNYICEEICFDKLTAQQMGNNITLLNNSLKKDFEREINKLLFDEYINNYLDKKFKITEEQIQESYIEKKNEINQNLQYWISIIYKSTDKCKNDKEKEEVKKALIEISSKLKKGENFDKLQKKYSDNPSDIFGNKQEPYKFNDLEPLIEDAVLSMKTKEISDVIELKDGFAILRLNKRRGGSNLQLDKVRDIVVINIKNEILSKELPKIISKLEKEIPTTKMKNFPNINIADIDTSSTLYKVQDYEFIGSELSLDKIKNNKEYLESAQKQLSKYILELYQNDLIAVKAIDEGYLNKKNTKKKYDMLVNHYLRNQKIEEMYEKMTPISDVEVKNFIRINQQYFMSPTYYESRELILSVKNNSKTSDGELEVEKKKTEKLAYELLDKIKNKKASFEELAKKYSIAHNAPKGGYIGWLSSETMSRIYDWAIQTLDKDGYSKPIYHEGRKEYTILKVDQTKQPMALPEQVAIPKAQKSMTIMKKNEIYENFRKNILESNKFQNVENVLSNVK